jgi:hypothetical protein
LPLRKWTSDYKEQLLNFPFVKSVREYHAEDSVDFEVNGKLAVIRTS